MDWRGVTESPDNAWSRHAEHPRGSKTMTLPMQEGLRVTVPQSALPGVRMPGGSALAAAVSR